MTSTASSQESHRASGFTIVFAMVFPTLVTWAYFVWMADEVPWLQQGTYGIGKSIQFVMPVVIWFVVLMRQRPPRRLLAAIKQELAENFRPEGKGLLLGAMFGAVVGGSMLLLFYVWLEPVGFFTVPGARIREKIAGLGLASAAAFIAVGAFYSLAHSLLEEYYWRWFVFRALKTRVPLGAAIFWSSLGFMAHHVILLCVYFGVTSLTTWLFSAGIVIGGAFWAWLYHDSRSLLGSWLSHCLVDAAIFWVGFEIASDLF